MYEHNAGVAWLFEASAVKCKIKFLNQRKPSTMMNQYMIADKVIENRCKTNRHDPNMSGCMHVTMM